MKKEFADRLNSMLIGKGWSQSELARRSGVPRDSVSAYCRGRSLPSRERLEQIALALRCDPSDLVPNPSVTRGTDPQPPWLLIEGIAGTNHVLMSFKRSLPNAAALKIFHLLMEVEEQAA